MPDLCFVMMPFGEKVNTSNIKIDFDVVYDHLLYPAIDKAGLKPIRDDEKKLGGLIIKTMLERIIFCDYAIADITFDNPNVFYELGIRHAVRPFTTIIIREQTYSNLPFDVSPIKVIYYEYDFQNRTIKEIEKKIEEIKVLLIECRKDVGASVPDSPIKQLFGSFDFPKLNKLRAASKDFEDWVSKLQHKIDKVDEIVSEWKELDNQFRKTEDNNQKHDIEVRKQNKIEELKNIEDENLIHDNPLERYSLLLSILKAYKDTNSTGSIIELLESIPERKREKYFELEERLAYAYKMEQKFDKAESIARKLISMGREDKHSSLNALTASIFKHKSEMYNSKFCLKESIRMYMESFESNPNEYYPGICLLNLLYTSDSKEWQSKYDKYFPLVEFSIERRLKKTNEYWGHVSMLELEVMRDNKEMAKENLDAALNSPHAPWKREVTAKHLKKVADYKGNILQQDVSWIHSIIKKMSEFTDR
jgi:hypothetical protein